jgi:two-component system cell cycle response regulator
MSQPPREDDDPDDDRTAIGNIRIPVSTRRDRAHLIVLAGENLGQMYRVDRSETVIGRGSDSDVRLQDEGVSRRHSRIVQEGGDVWIEDLGSANGTYIDDARVERHMLRDGDKIRMGSTTILKFTYADELEENFQQKMYDAALYDALTKACNKRHFLDRLPVEISYAKRHRTPLALLMLDVDHFKEVNDRHGHLAGDHVLATIAQIVRAALRTEDLFARYGGEEFSVLCRDTTPAKAALLAERLRSKVEAHAFEHHRRPIGVTISIGVAAWAEEGDTPTQLMADADAALYEAKRGGRNRVVASAAKADSEDGP